MFAHSRRVLLPAGLLAGFLLACAPLRPANDIEATDSTATTPEPRPAPGTTLTSEDIERAPGQPIEMVMEGRFPGVVVYQTPSGIAVRIRGVSSFYGSNEPLYVLDGIPIQAGPHGALSGINARDIAKIEVLKDPAQTSMYGMRGANGVIVITTKRPGQ